MLWNLSTVGNNMHFPIKPKFSIFFESEDENLISLVNILNTIQHEDWDITPLMNNTFSDLSLKEQMELINKKAFEKAMGFD